MTESKIKEALQRHEDHLPEDTFETLCADPDDAFYTLENIESVRGVKGGAVRVNMTDGSSMWFYRRVEITLHEEVPTGYWGRWTTGGYRNGRGFDTLSDAVRDIDARIMERNLEGIPEPGEHGSHCSCPGCVGAFGA